MINNFNRNISFKSSNITTLQQLQQKLQQNPQGIHVTENDGIPCGESYRLNSISPRGCRTQYHEDLGYATTQYVLGTSKQGSKGTIPVWLFVKPLTGEVISSRTAKPMTLKVD